MTYINVLFISLYVLYIKSKNSGNIEHIGTLNLILYEIKVHVYY
jgi:hypothetical protein